jgi:hypothetical protein
MLEKIRTKQKCMGEYLSDENQLNLAKRLKLQLDTGENVSSTFDIFKNNLVKIGNFINITLNDITK